MPTKKNSWTTTHNGRSIDVWEVTDGQMAVLAQQMRIMKRSVRSNAGSESFQAVGTMMAILDNLVVHDDDQDYLGDLLIEGDITVAELLELLLGSENVVEEADAAPQTIVKRTTTTRRK